MQPFPLPERHGLSREESGKKRLGSEQLRSLRSNLKTTGSQPKSITEAMANGYMRAILIKSDLALPVGQSIIAHSWPVQKQRSINDSDTLLKRLSAFPIDGEALPPQTATG